MQNLNWNDLRYVLALQRGRTLAAAANLIGVDETTVSRRLKVLSGILGDELCWRQRDGTLTLTDLGNAVARHAEAMEAGADQISDLVGGKGDHVSGTVRLTSVPFLTNRWLARHAGSLLSQHPGLTLELIPDSRDFNLNLREADVALRLSRPRTGGTNTLARRIGTLPFAVYATGNLQEAERSSLPWIGYDETTSDLPQAVWIARTARSNGDPIAGLKVMDVETALEATLAGAGKTLLPRPIAQAIPELADCDGGKPVLEREVWLLTHRNQSETKRVKAVVSWLLQILRF